MINAIKDFAPDDVEAGVGLVLQDTAGYYLFFLAGTRHHCPPGELFYAGIGGHREPGEDWLTCAHREAKEETGTGIELLSSSITWHISCRGDIEQLTVIDRPGPFAFYEMIHPPDSPRAGGLYRLVIFKARLLHDPSYLPPDEVQGIIALTPEQVVQGLNRKPSLKMLLDEGAALVAGGGQIDPETCLYPLGTARALAHVLSQIRDWTQATE